MTVIEWECDEHHRHERGRLWHVAMPLLGVGLLIYAVGNANFLFAFIIILFSVLVYMRSLGEPQRIVCRVSEFGLTVGQRELRMRDIKRFWFAYEPPAVKILYAETDGFLNARLAVHLDETDPNRIRAILGQYVPEDFKEVGEPLSDFMSRLLKL